MIYFTPKRSLRLISITHFIEVFDFLEVDYLLQKVAGHHHPREADHPLPRAVDLRSLRIMDHHPQTMMMNTRPILTAVKKMGMQVPVKRTGNLLKTDN